MRARIEITMVGAKRSKMTVRDVPLDNQTVIIRVDLDVPLGPGNEILDDSLIQSVVPTLHYLIGRNCRVVMIGHATNSVGIGDNQSLESAAIRLASLLGHDIRLADSVVGDRVKQATKRTAKGSILMLENLYFHPGERLNDIDFAKSLVKSTGARYFINDSPTLYDKEYASLCCVPLIIPAVAGLSLEKSDVLANESRAIIGLLDGWR